jgi:hypothetical protein
MIRLLPHPLPTLPPSPQQFVSLSQSSCESPDELTDERGGEGGGRGAKSYDREKARVSKNHSTLSEVTTPQVKCQTVFFFLTALLLY